MRLATPEPPIFSTYSATKQPTMYIQCIKDKLDHHNTSTPPTLKFSRYPVIVSTNWYW